MTILQLTQILEQWAPRWAAMKYDNVGLQIGNPHQEVKKVLIALEITHKIIDEALSRKVELIITHHPLLFKPLSSITNTDIVGKLVLRLLEKKIAVYSAHTNLDFSRDGVSFALAKKLGLQNIQFLSPLKDTLAKIIVFVPESHVGRVREAMAQAGAGIIGKYSYCSFVTKGRGSFLGATDSSPFVGKAGVLEQVDEVRLEMIAPRADVQRVIGAMKSSHPYEEIAYDVLHTKTLNENFGIGAIGSLPFPQPLKAFLKKTKQALRAKSLRYAGNSKKQVQQIAVCSGGGSEVLPDAIRAQADVLITADVRYHTFHTAVDAITLIDAGHWETEQVVLQTITKQLRKAMQDIGMSLQIYVTRYSTNPIQVV